MPACFPSLLVLHSVPGFPTVIQGGQNLSVYIEFYHCYQFAFTFETVGLGSLPHVCHSCHLVIKVRHVAPNNWILFFN